MADRRPRRSDGLTIQIAFAVYGRIIPPTSVPCARASAPAAAWTAGSDLLEFDRAEFAHRIVLSCFLRNFRACSTAASENNHAGESVSGLDEVCVKSERVEDVAVDVADFFELLTASDEIRSILVSAFACS
jgi:hypothetical protein